MARLAPITGKNHVDTKDHAAVDAIVQSRGAIQEPFMMFLHCPELARCGADLGAFVRFEGSLDMRVRVLAAMTVARELDAVYVWGPRRAAPAGWACRTPASRRSAKSTRAASRPRTPRS